MLKNVPNEKISKLLSKYSPKRASGGSQSGVETIVSGPAAGSWTRGCHIPKSAILIEKSSSRNTLLLRSALWINSGPDFHLLEVQFECNVGHIVVHNIPPA